MDLEKIESVIKLMRSYGLHELEVKDQDNTVRVVATGREFPAYPSFAPPQPVYPFAAPPMPHAEERPKETPHVGKHEHAGDGERAVYAEKNHPHAAEVRSPFVGTFYASSSPGSDPFVAIGKKVKKGDTLCIIEAMKLMNEIEADRDGVVVEILAENEQPIEFNQILFLIE